MPTARLSSKAVFLVGFMGAGKSSVGHALGQRLNWLFEDLDNRIERREGRSVAGIFQDAGESGFREAEHRALGEVLEELRAGSFRVVALGGGAFIQPKNAALMKASGVPIVFLDASVAELWERCCKQAVASGAERPLLRSEQQFRELYEARRKAYLKAPLRIETGGRSVEQIANEIVDRLSLQPMGVRTEQGEVE